MYTPQEAREGATSFDRAVFGGYNMKSVDDFLTPLVEDYSALHKENAVLKSKLKVLVEKLEEFHQREDSMNKAILAAQKTSDEMIMDTERKCARMLSDTEETMRIRREQLEKELAVETERVNRAKKTASTFILHVEEQMHKAVEQLEDVRQMSLTPKQKAQNSQMPVVQPATPAATRETAEQVSRQIEVNISRIIGGEEEDVVPAAPAAPTPAPQRTPEEILGDTMVIEPIRD